MAAMPDDAHVHEPPVRTFDAKLSDARLKRAVRGGAGITTASHVTGQVIGLGVLAVLYRLVAPADYGLLAMVMPLLALANLFTAPGFSVATVQRQNLLPGHVSTLFWLNLALSGAIALAMVVASPLMAWFYGEGQVGWLSVALAGTVVITALGTQHQALLERHLRLAPVAIARLTAHVLAGAAAIAVAWAGWGAWALVTQLYVNTAVITAVLWYLEPWRPQRPRRGEGARELVQFGGFYTASSLMFYISQYIDKVLVGYALGAVALGLYSQAFNVMLKPVYLLTMPLAGVMLPGLSRAVGDAAAYRGLLFAFSRLLAVTMLPAGVGLLIVAPEVMLVLGGPRWADAGPILQALAAAIVVQGFMNSAGSVITSSGRADRLFRAATAMAIVLSVGFVAGLLVGYAFEAPLMGVAWGYTVTMLVLWLPYMRFALASVGISLGDWLAEVRRPLAATIGMALVVVTVRWLLLGALDLHPAALLACETSVGAAAYLLLGRNEIRWLADQLRQLRAGWSGS